MNLTGLLDPKALGAIPNGLRGAQFQLGYVVRDLDASMHLWSTLLGIGPWIAVRYFPGYEFIHRGHRVDVEWDAAFAYFGDIQIELICQRNDAPSPYREFLAAGREGLQHFGFLTRDYSGAVQAARDAKMEPAYVVGPKGAHNMTIYFEIPNSAQPMFEVVDLTPPKEALFNAIKALGKGWDGTHPVRRFESGIEFLASLAKG